MCIVNDNIVIVVLMKWKTRAAWLIYKRWSVNEYKCSICATSAVKKSFFSCFSVALHTWVVIFTFKGARVLIWFLIHFLHHKNKQGCVDFYIQIYLVNIAHLVMVSFESNWACARLLLQEVRVIQRRCTDATADTGGNTFSLISMRSFV